MGTEHIEQLVKEALQAGSKSTVMEKPRRDKKAQVVTKANPQRVKRVASEKRTRLTYTQTRVIKVSQETMLRNRIIAGSPQEPWANAYKLLRTRVLQRLKESDNANTLAITSPTPGAGKSLTALNLALSIAMEVNKTVLLVDADLRRPSLHTYFGIEPEYGLSDYLTKDIPLEEMLINPGIGRFVYLPAGKPIGNSSEMLASPRMEDLAKEIKERYRSRYVVFDMPPMLAVSDVLAFSPYVDAALLVVEEGVSKDEDVTYCVDLLRDVNLIGTVLNKSTETTNAYYSY